MANPTNPFSWQMPMASDLVTDLPADFEIFGQAVATSLADLLGGTTGQVLAKATNTNMDFTWVTPDDANAIQNAIVDAKGDLIAATAADTPARLAVGTNGQVLTADSTAATGLAWATPASSGGMTLLSTTTFSSSGITISSISQDYKDLVGVVVGLYSTSNTSGTYLRPNSDSGSNYVDSGIRNIGSTVAATFDIGTSSFIISPRSATSNTATKKSYGRFVISRYTEAEAKVISSVMYGTDETSATSLQIVGAWNNTTAISSLNVFSDSTFSGGTLYLYGVK